MIAVYARQSVDKKESISIESQIQLCRYEIHNDAEEVRVYRDKGYSGRNIKRPAFTEMMNDVKAGLIRKIIVYRLDRFSRSIADFGMIWEILEKNNVEFVSVNEKFDTTTPIGVAMLNIIMVFAQLERQTIAERVKDNYYARAKIGSWTGGSAPYGFKLTKVMADGKRCSSLAASDEMKIVMRIFKEYAKEDSTLGGIAKSLTEENIPCIQRKTWDNITISRILRNPVYVKCDPDVYIYLERLGVRIESPVEAFDGKKAGLLLGKRNRSKEKYNSPEDQYFTVALHDGVIDSDTWLRCQDKLSKNKQINNRGAGKHSWLTGLLKCGNCGYGLSIIKAKEKLYLSCTGRTHYHICKEIHSGFDIRELEELVFNEMRAMFSTITTETKVNECNFSEELKNINSKIDRLVEAISEGSSISMKYINKELEKLEKQRERLLNKSADKPVVVVSGKKFDDTLSLEEKNKLAKALIERIELLGEDVKVIWRV